MKIMIKTEKGRIHSEELKYGLNSVGLENSGSGSGGSWAYLGRCRPWAREKGLAS
jgi:hypothetical protein